MTRQRLIAPLLGLLALAACRTASPPAKSDFSASGVRLPADARLLAEDDGGRKGEDFRRSLIRSSPGIAIPAAQPLEVPVDSWVRVIETLAPGERVRPASATARVYEWENAQGAWRAALVDTGPASYLVLERFRKKE